MDLLRTDSQLSRNALLAMVQVVCVGFVLFLTYKFLVSELGVDQLGLWSLLLAVFSVGRVFELGLPAATTARVAELASAADRDIVHSVVRWALMATCLFVGVALVAGYWVVSLVLEAVVSPERARLAGAILPYAAMTTWAGATGGIFQAALVGRDRADLRSLILTATAVLNWVLCLGFVPRWGLLGLAWAQTGQMAITMLASGLAFAAVTRRVATPARGGGASVLGGLLAYGWKVQLGSSTALLYEPTTKVLLSKFAGVEAVGYFEMANRLVVQVRALLISANSVIVPRVSWLQRHNPSVVAPLFRANYAVVLYLSCCVFAVLLGLAPSVSEIWLGRLDPTFVQFSVLVTVAWCVNVLNGPAYFFSLGTGDLYWNTASHVAIAILNVIAGVLGGLVAGGVGIVAGWSAALALGSMMISVPMWRQPDPEVRRIVVGGFVRALMITVAAGAVGLQTFRWVRPSVDAVVGAVVSACVPLIIALVVGWREPLARDLLAALRSAPRNSLPVGLRGNASGSEVP